MATMARRVSWSIPGDASLTIGRHFAAQATDMLQVTSRQYIRTASEQVAATLVPACYPAATTWGCPNGLQLCSSHESIPLGVTPLAPNWVIIPIPHCESLNKGSIVRQNSINIRLTMHNPVYMSLIQGNAVKRKCQELTHSLGPVM